MKQFNNRAKQDNVRIERLGGLLGAEVYKHYT